MAEITKKWIESEVVGFLLREENMVFLIECHQIVNGKFNTRQTLGIFAWLSSVSGTLEQPKSFQLS